MRRSTRFETLKCWTELDSSREVSAQSRHERTIENTFFVNQGREAANVPRTRR